MMEFRVLPKEVQYGPRQPIVNFFAGCNLQAAIEIGIFVTAISASGIA
jgi:hypothetical protein